MSSNYNHLREPPFGKLLVANRGEVAVRVIRACRELGVSSVAVYSEADEGAMHVRLADESYLIGLAPAAESYLNVEKILTVAKESGAAAVHPGYGFLSENAGFARAVEEAGLAWIGPPSEAMEKVGDKVRAKELAREAEVPTIPGYSGEENEGDEAEEERLLEEAERIGFPVLVKASGGGGGRGMRPVHEPENFVEAVRGAKREAEAAFGTGAVFLEKFIENPRHIEVQIVADHHGNVLHLYERECSIQRRHQKIVEEAPSPVLSEDLREVMGEAAVRLALTAGYRNAGTVEFLLDGESFYFLEMNARLQVEHPVTELVTGLDLVHLQLAVAAGELLPFAQEDVATRGAAIEARLYAEDPYTGLPSGGMLRAWAPPVGPGIRNDAGVEAGDEVSLNYDPMLAKLIVCGPDRAAAVLRLRRALEDYTVLGAATNLPLLQRIANEPAFAAGETTTGFIEEHGLDEPLPAPPPPREVLLLAAAGELARTRAPDGGDPFEAGSWRLGGVARLVYRGTDGEEYPVEARRESGRTDACRLVSGGEASLVEMRSLSDGEIRAVVDGRAVSSGFALEERILMVSLDGTSYTLERPAAPDVDRAASEATEGASLTAPMPGTVVKVLVGEGDEVDEGQTLLVLEAMKMEQSVAAPHNGIVVSLPYAEGDRVAGGAVLAEVEAAG
ncbi:MAG TPA: biotin carboxylase N-terminal domain-containing protein [Rubrobacteraceae bacterium]|nr:biotin carboxylase N-terminal domain-containing protein [Rubrobacteraceae bacterium]